MRIDHLRLKIQKLMAWQLVNYPINKPKDFNESLICQMFFGKIKNLAEGHKMADARIVANFVLDRADEAGKQITNLDLQKIVYFLHGHYLCRYKKPLVDSEFEAWTYGPVHKSIYDAFKSYNDSPISGRATAFNPVTRQRRELEVLSDESAISLINEYLQKYLNMSTYSLVQLTHNDGTPWSRTVNDAERQVNIGMRISDELIKECFEGVLETA